MKPSQNLLLTLTLLTCLHIHSMEELNDNYNDDDMRDEYALTNNDDSMPNLGFDQLSIYDTYNDNNIKNSLTNNQNYASLDREHKDTNNTIMDITRDETTKSQPLVIDNKHLSDFNRHIIFVIKNSKKHEKRPQQVYQVQVKVIPTEYEDEIRLYVQEPKKEGLSSLVAKNFISCNGPVRIVSAHEYNHAIQNFRNQNL